MMRVRAGKKRADSERKSESESERVGLVGGGRASAGAREPRADGLEDAAGAEAGGGATASPPPLPAEPSCEPCRSIRRS